jgi:chromosome segregation protein
MLKALELTGFKSFADRTRFDFPDGITVVVGPNGSGKSNVVDAVKWVLGAQSAKSLRGADMADVIFKGSAEGGRKPANSAEVVLILDNSEGIFHHEAPEVHVCRRVFRSGEGEYAINGQPCRLKDVKDLFRGTGVGVDAYSLIEQGKVDRLLQASAKDRRGIFEEAAGISRFKAKKVEAERRLQRVDQNLLRLSDIVDEVGKRLQTLKSQATKAQRYRELSQQLQERRTQLGWSEYRHIQLQCESQQRQLHDSATQRSGLESQWKELEDVAERERLALQALQTSLQSLQQQFLDTQRQVISAESGYQSATARVDELTAEQQLIEERLVALQQRANLSAEELEQRNLELLEIQTQQSDAQNELRTREFSLQQTQEALKVLSRRMDEQNQLHSESMQSIQDLKSRIVAYQFLIEQTQASLEDLNRHQQIAQEERSTFETEALQVHQQADLARQRAEDARRDRSEAEQQLQSDRKRLYEQQEQVASIQGKLHGVRERLFVLTQLEDQFAGDGRGGQQLLRLARGNQSLLPDLSNAASLIPNPWGSVKGLVADILASEMHLAPLIDVALGPLSDAIILTNGQLVDWINEGTLAVEGRVTLLRLDRLPNRRSGEKIQLDGLRGVIGRADRLVQYSTEYEPLVRALLGTTWFVDSLATALELSHFRGAGLRFVTAECQLIDSDGSITIGSLQAGLGLISRRAEMQTAREEIKHLEVQLQIVGGQLSSTQSQVRDQESKLKELESIERSATKESSRFDSQLENMNQRREQLNKRCQEIADQIASAELRIRDSEAQADSAHLEITQLEELQRRQETDLSHHKSKWVDIQSELSHRQAAASDQRVVVARLEQRHEGLKATLEQLHLDATERDRVVDQTRKSLETIRQRIESSRQSAAEHQASMESYRVSAEQIELTRSEQSQQLEAQNSVANQAIRQCDHLRRQLEKNEDRIAQLTDSLQKLSEQQSSLIAHYLSEYGIELHPRLPADLEHADISETLKSFLHDLFSIQSQDPLVVLKSNIDAETVTIRNELTMTGSVNMEALAELDELQGRYDRLAGHQNDLIEAKNSLIKTMNKIDEDSQHLFMETLQSIRKNFQDLYRRSFGGGFADILLENEADPESGIEIIATPPGKTTLSNSLLSGGEKALTAVALIMSFFQYRPSPFCILDEVDAPFDEANIGRFVTVLREFLASTKFIVVTHSKKTMTAANMIYGVTMQESGVSRQVSVRFEEVNEKGEIITPEKRLAA